MLLDIWQIILSHGGQQVVYFGPYGALAFLFFRYVRHMEKHLDRLNKTLDDRDKTIALMNKQFRKVYLQPKGQEDVPQGSTDDNYEEE